MFLGVARSGQAEEEGGSGDLLRHLEDKAARAFYGSCARRKRLLQLLLGMLHAQERVLGVAVPHVQMVGAVGEDEGGRGARRETSSPKRHADSNDRQEEEHESRPIARREPEHLPLEARLP
eukprot:764732-Hanusia_phi.AAC.2